MKLFALNDRYPEQKNCTKNHKNYPSSVKKLQDLLFDKLVLFRKKERKATKEFFWRFAQNQRGGG